MTVTQARSTSTASGACPPEVRYCIIGAGAAGIAVAKSFVQRGIPFDLLERENDLGGLWNIATPSGIVYESTHLVSAISSTGYDDLPMLDADYPEYPSHDRVLGYFRDYVAKFGIGPHIEFSKSVDQVKLHTDGRYSVAVKGEASSRTYTGVVVANGHHDAPRTPSYPGTFTGEMIHSRQYKSQRQVRDKRVLVVGAGNSACDIIKDAAHASGAKVVMSMRRGTWFVPKFLLGFPTHDVVANVEWILTPLPRVLKNWLFQASLFVLQGPPSRYRLPDPTYRIDQAHPTMSDDIPRLAAHGRIVVRPEIERYDGNTVHFVDGSRDAVDMIIFGTGYALSIPFLERTLYATDNGKPHLYLNTAHPEHDGLYFAGLIQANGSIWRLADYQGQLIANAIVARQQAPGEHAAFRSRAQAEAGPASATTFVASERHKLEANYYDYARQLKREARRFPAARKQRLITAAAGQHPRAMAAE
jgi:Flavin-binding monooxygenase-like